MNTMNKTKAQKTLNATTRAKRAFNLVKSGRYKNHIGAATPAKSRMYKLGQLVTSIDPWKMYDHNLTFVKSIRWPGGGGYLVLDKFGKPHTTTNIRPASIKKAASKA
jgi:hypothetical protein